MILRLGYFFSECFFLIFEIIHLLLGKSMVSDSASSVRRMVEISYSEKERWPNTGVTTILKGF